MPACAADGVPQTQEAPTAQEVGAKLAPSLIKLEALKSQAIQLGFLGSRTINCLAPVERMAAMTAFIPTTSSPFPLSQTFQLVYCGSLMRSNRIMGLLR